MSASSTRLLGLGSGPQSIEANRSTASIGTVTRSAVESGFTACTGSADGLPAAEERDETRSRFMIADSTAA